MEKILGKKGYAGVVLLDLSKAFDTVNHELLIAKLQTYGFDMQSLKTVMSYLSNRLQRVKINTNYSTWSEILAGVPQGSVLGPLLFNLYLNDLFFELQYTDPCNFADDTSPSACDMSLRNVLWKLEIDTLSTITWCESNYMKINADKFKLLLMGVRNQLHHINIGKEIIWESKSVKLLGVDIYNDLSFDNHVKEIYRKANRKLSALRRVSRYAEVSKKRVLFKSFIESQFTYCPLIWMFHSRQLNNKINQLHERALRIVYKNYELSFEELLFIDGSFCVHHRNIHAVAIEMYKQYHKMSPEITTEIFDMKNPDEDHFDVFKKTRSRTVAYGDQSLKNFGPEIWNIVPGDIKGSSSLKKFKDKIKEWKPVNCPCRLCKIFVKGVGFI